MSGAVDAELHRRASRHEAVAHLAQRALAGADLADLFAEAASTVAALTGGDATAIRASFDGLWSGHGAETDPQSLQTVHNGAPRDEDGGFVQAVAVVLAGAVGAERARDEERRASLHDPLTGLPNRALAADRLAHALVRAGPGSVVAIFVLDLDDFRLLNDTHGRDAGDEVLVEVARRLTVAVGPAGTVGRMGADTFTVTYEAATVDHIDAAAEAVHRCFDEPFPTADAEVFVSASIGIAVAPSAAPTPVPSPAPSAATPRRPDALLHEADVALYAAKQSGRGRRERFRDDMRVEAIERLEMRNALRRALERSEFKVWFQPEIALDGDHVVGFEALVRWEHPQLGVVSSAAFIPLAEETGLIVPLGEWVIRQACEQLRRWRQDGTAPPDLVVSVNLSTRQVAHPELPDVVRAALAENGPSSRPASGSRSTRARS